MNPLWFVVAAVVALRAIPIAAIGLVHRRHVRRERALAKRRKTKIQL